MAGTKRVAGLASLRFSVAQLKCLRHFPECSGLRTGLDNTLELLMISFMHLDSVPERKHGYQGHSSLTQGISHKYATTVLWGRPNKSAPLALQGRQQHITPSGFGACLQAFILSFFYTHTSSDQNVPHTYKF